MSEHPLKVLSVSTSDSLGGAGKAAYRIHQAVRELGVDCSMLVKHKGTCDPSVLSSDTFISQNALYKGFDWMRNKVQNRREHYLWGKYPDRQKFFLSDLRSTDIGHALQKIDYDILHLHWVNLRFLPLEQLPKDKPIVWTLHDSWPFCGVCHVPMDCKGYMDECGSCPLLGSSFSNDLSHRVWREKKRIFDKLDLHIVTPSQWMADNARRSSLFKGRDITVIPNCIDTSLFYPKDRLKSYERFHLDPSKKHILFGAMSATRDPNKGLRFLLEALSGLDQSIKEMVDIVILGTDEPIGKLMHGFSTHDLGNLMDERDMIAAYSAADLTIVPSLSENLSCTIMESLSCGTPVVAFNIGGNGDMIEHKVNGYLAREKDSDSLSNGIAWILSQDRDSLYESARSIVLEHYTPKKVGLQYLAKYNELI